LKLIHLAGRTYISGVWNRALRKILGPKREEITGDWRKLHKEELHNLYSLPNINRIIKSRRMRWMRHAACIREMKNAYRMLIRKLEGKRPFGMSRH
jgi:hypothetical protein